VERLEKTLADCPEQADKLADKPFEHEAELRELLARPAQLNQRRTLIRGLNRPYPRNRGTLPSRLERLKAHGSRGVEQSHGGASSRVNSEVECRPSSLMRSDSSRSLSWLQEKHHLFGTRASIEKLDL
jgi:hypothetical protein